MTATLAQSQTTIPGQAPIPEPCRLCGGATSYRFSQPVLRKYPVCYWQCETCGSMQTDKPTWLDEAYRTVHSATDTGMAARTLQMASLTSLILRVAGVGPQTVCLDWGGGNGLFCRMMRDQGYNFWNSDKYAEPFYCAGFSTDGTKLSQCDIVTSFELFEHLPDPKTELAQVLDLAPRLWIFSTQLYENQPQNWNYFAPRLGRHVCFYSAKALSDFAAKHGYLFIRGRHLHILLKGTDNPHFRSAAGRSLARNVLHGGKIPALAAGLHFMARQRHAYRHWGADSDRVRQFEQGSAQPDLP